MNPVVAETATAFPTQTPMSSKTAVNGIPQGWQASVLSWLGGPIQRRLATWGGQLRLINSYEAKLSAEDNRDLRKRSLALREKATSGW